LPRVPDPPVPFPEPLVHPWTANRRIVRCHDVSFGATEFNPGGASRRFRPVVESGAVVPTLYGSNSVPGALSESVFHDVPVRGRARRVQRKLLTPVVRSIIVPTRELRLAQLHGSGLPRLGVTHGEIVESSSRQYPRTAAWGQVLYEHPLDLDGVIWVSRQHDTSFAVMLWGTRVDRLIDLEPDPSEHPLPLYVGHGFQEVEALANDMGIVVVQ
jgi:hypothetical protein